MNREAAKSSLGILAIVALIAAVTEWSDDRQCRFIGALAIAVVCYAWVVLLLVVAFAADEIFARKHLNVWIKGMLVIVVLVVWIATMNAIAAPVGRAWGCGW